MLKMSDVASYDSRLLAGKIGQMKPDLWVFNWAAHTTQQPTVNKLNWGKKKSFTPIFVFLQYVMADRCQGLGLEARNEKYWKFQFSICEDVQDWCRSRALGDDK